MSETQFDFGMIGLGTMGHALLLNMADHGFAVAGYDTNPEKAAAIDSTDPKQVIKGFTNVKAFVDSIRKPRAIMMLVPAGAPVDSVIATLQPLMEPGDFLIDGGNSHFRDTERREKALRDASFGFIGMGVSGGEAGARIGPSMMPGGTPVNYERIRPILEAVAAKEDGRPCVALMGAGSAGHYVKMVHNGIEYAMMQLIAEVYDILHRGLGWSNDSIADAFGEWNQTEMGGFLMEITSTVLRKKDELGDGDLVNMVSDKAKSKGTGKWTSQDAMDLGLPIPAIDAAVSARELSGYKAERVAVSKLLGGELVHQLPTLSSSDLANALELAFILSYTQGLAQIRAASDEYRFGTELGQVVQVWRAGCIIRSRLLGRFHDVLDRSPSITNLLLDADFASNVRGKASSLRHIVVAATTAGLPVPALSASLAYLDGYRSAQLPANLIQAQRDFFGAHTYERTDREGSFHTHWQS